MDNPPTFISIYINLQLPTYLNKFSIIKFRNVNNVSDINGWPLAIVCKMITMDKGKDRNEVHHWLRSRRIKNNIRDQKSTILLPFKSYSKQNKPSDPVPKLST
jgi:hypothetical protein